MSDAHKTFVRESEEGITDLNNALLDLEADPDDPEAMDLIFRTAHTLKGNAAAMGFEQFSGLAHAMEDLLDEVRDGEIEVTTELMDMLFEAVDILDAMLGEIDETGDTTTETAGLEERLRAVADGEVDLGGDDDAAATETDTGTADATGADAAGDEAGTADTGTDGADTDDGDAADAGTDGGDAADPETHAHGLEPDDDEGVYLASVDVGDTGMPGVDAMFVLEAVEESFPAVETLQDREAIEDGEFDETFELYVRDEDAETVSAGLSAVSQVAALDVTTLEPSPADDESAGDDGATADETTAGDSATATDTSSPADETDAGDGDETDETAADTASTTSSSESISSIRVDVEQLDDLYGLVEQLVTSRIKLRREMEEAGIDSENLDELDKISSNLQNTVMDMRLIPLSSVVDTFPRLVRDLARDQDKQVDFEIDGRDIELDRTILTEIRDPLVHILRNAVDHGIESPAEREAAGKEPTGNIELRASRERDHVNIVVEDDGAGIEADDLREMAVEEGVKTAAEAEAMDDSEARELIFHPGLSTNEEVTDVSGRGVGMDVVRTTVKQLDGTVSLQSTPGEGSRFELRLPVTVAIVRVMFVEVDGTEYGIPIKNIAEVSRAGNIETVNDEEVVRHDGDIYPVIHLREVLQDNATASGPTPAAADGGHPEDGPGAPAEPEADGVTDAPAEPEATADTDVATDTGRDDILDGSSDDGMLVRIREETRPVALHCDEVLHQEEVVVKPLEGILSGIPGLSGTAVLGDGDVVTILDVETLGEAY